MTVLVTGASGFLGGALAQTLVEGREPLRVLVRRTSDISHLRDLPVELVFGDLGDLASLETALKGVRLVYNCAGTATDWASWETFYHGNVLGVRNLMEAASRAPSLERLVHVSTSDVYGYPRVACDEAHPLTDIGLPYNRSKCLGEEVVWEYHREKGLPLIVIRPVSIYGPRSMDFVSEIASALVTGQMLYINGGHSPAGLLYIDNAVAGMIQAAHSPATVGEAYNLRDETNETWRNYIEALARGLGVPSPRWSLPEWAALAAGRVSELIYGALKRQARPLITRHAVYVLSRDQSYAIEKARRDFGFRSFVSFDEGVQRSLEWLKSGESGIELPR